MALDAYHVPEAIQAQALNKIRSMDVVATANAVLKQLFAMLEMTFDFKFSRNE